MHRVLNIDARFRDIEGEKADLLRALGERTSQNANSPPQAKSAEAQRTGGFKIKY